MNHDRHSAAARSRIGIITGSGTEAGVDLWNKLLRANRALLGPACGGGLDAPEVVIFSVPELGLSMELQRNDERVRQALRRTAERMAPHVDHYGIARVALLGARPVMELGPWSAHRQLPRHAGVELPADPDERHAIIYEVKRRGGDQPDIVARFERVLAGLQSELALLDSERASR